MWSYQAITPSSCTGTQRYFLCYVHHSELFLRSICTVFTSFLIGSIPCMFHVFLAQLLNCSIAIFRVSLSCVHNRTTGMTTGMIRTGITNSSSIHSQLNTLPQSLPTVDAHNRYDVFLSAFVDCTTLPIQQLKNSSQGSTGKTLHKSSPSLQRVMLSKTL